MFYCWREFGKKGHITAKRVKVKEAAVYDAHNHIVFPPIKFYLGGKKCRKALFKQDSESAAVPAAL